MFEPLRNCRYRIALRARLVIDAELCASVKVSLISLVFCHLETEFEINSTSVVRIKRWNMLRELLPNAFCYYEENRKHANHTDKSVLGPSIRIGQYCICYCAYLRFFF